MIVRNLTQSVPHKIFRNRSWVQCSWVQCSWVQCSEVQCSEVQRSEIVDLSVNTYDFTYFEAH